MPADASHPLTTAQRGYNAQHKRERERWRPFVEAGQVSCWRCGDPIEPDDAWDLGHDDDDRSLYRGPEHAARCNRAAGGRKGRRQAAVIPSSIDW